MNTIEKNLIEGLKTLDQKMTERNLPPIEINVVGDLVLSINNIREGKNAYASIDCINPAFSKEMKELIEEVGTQYNFGFNFFNTPVEESINTYVGKLNFKDSGLKLNSIKVNTIDLEEQMMLCIHLIDTESTVFDLPLPDFTRYTELQDIVEIAEKLEINLPECLMRLEDEGFITDHRTAALIETFQRTGEMDYKKLISKVREDFLPDYNDKDQDPFEADYDSIIKSIEDEEKRN